MQRRTQALAMVGGTAAVLSVYALSIRPWHLHWGARDDELKRKYPGDDLIPGVTEHVTHAITVSAAPEQIWPWLMQIGQDRSGFYSYTPLENLFGCRMPRVERLVPEWRDRQVGEKVWFATPHRFDGKAYMQAAIVEPQRAYVLSAGADLAAQQAATWGFFLQPVDSHRTRLIVRARAAKPTSIMRHISSYAFWEPAHFFMERRMLLRIKRLSESAA